MAIVQSQGSRPIRRHFSLGAGRCEMRGVQVQKGGVFACRPTCSARQWSLLRCRAILLALILVLAGIAPARAEGGFDQAWNAAAADYQAGLREEGVVGSTLLLSQNGKLLRSVYYGQARIDTNSKVDADTIYHWASITKLFTTIAVLQLRDRGRLKLTDRIVDYLPETKQIHNPYGPMSDITLAELITHSSGLRAATFPWGHGQDWYPHEPRDWSQVAAMMPYSEIEFKPGSKFSYSNPGMSMLGRVIEEVTGEHVETYITKNVLMPLGMTRSFFDTVPYYLLPHRSANYEIVGGVPKPGRFEVETGATRANGGLNGPMSDLLKLAHFLLGVGDNGNYDAVLSRSSVKEMLTPRILADEFDRGDAHFVEHMGYGAFIVDVTPKTGDPIRVFGHTGGQSNFTSFLYIHPESGAAAVLGVNSFAEDYKGLNGFNRARVDLFTRIFPLLARGGRPKGSSHAMEAAGAAAPKLAANLAHAEIATCQFGCNDSPWRCARSDTIPCHPASAR